MRLGFALVGAVVLLVPLGRVMAQDDSAAPVADQASAPDAAAPLDAMQAPNPDDGSNAATGPTDDGASFQTFYDGLSDQGTWIQTTDYGYVWQPQVNDPEWAPYTAGRWAYTDEGWTWVSDESFGWATYHYGRWVNLDGTGWVWVPGYTWAPAWVSWRFGDGYAGWAPLPPDSFVGVDYVSDGTDADFGYHIGGDSDAYYGIGAGLYIFLPVNCLCYHDYRGRYWNRRDNFALINRTTNVTNINVSRRGAAVTGGNFRRVTVGGPALAAVNAASQSPIQKVNLVHTSARGGGTLSSNSLALYTPRVHAGTNLQPARVGGTIAHAQINHGIDITQPPAVNSRLTPVAATPAQVDAARVAQQQAPSSAKVLTDATAVRPVLQAPLTAMRPAARESSRTFNSAPVYNSGAPRTVYPGATSAPASGQTPYAAPARAYNNAPGYPPSTYLPRGSVPSPAGGNSEAHTYVRPSAPAPAEAPAARSSSPSSEGGRGSSSNGSSSGGATSGTTSGAAASGTNGRNH